MRHNVQVGDVWRIRIGCICATYLMVGHEGELWYVHHLERGKPESFHSIWFDQKHPDYEKWEKIV